MQYFRTLGYFTNLTKCLKVLQGIILFASYFMDTPQILHLIKISCLEKLEVEMPNKWLNGKGIDIKKQKYNDPSVKFGKTK